MGMKLILSTIISFAFFLTSCGYMFKPNERKEVKIATTGTPIAFELEDPGCQLGSSKPKFSDKVKIWMVDQEGELSQQTFNLANVSRAGLESHAVSEALYSPKDIDKYELMLEGGFKPISQFKDTKALRALSHEHKRGVFNRIDFCRAGGGYKPDSIENAALAAFVAINQTYQIHSKTQLEPGVKKHLEKVKLFVHPKLFAMQNKYVREFYVDNAFWANLGSFKMIAVLPHSKEWEDAHKLRFWETPGVFSHEYGHHIFHSYGPSVESPSRNLLYHREFYRINDGFNEGFADLISYFSLSDRKQFNPALLLTGKIQDHQNRDVNTPNLEYEARNFQLSIQKKYDEKVVEILGSTYSYNLRQLDAEGYHIQECHESGSIMAYVFNQLMDRYGYQEEPVKKMELLLTWLDRQENLMRQMQELTSPPIHLEASLKSLPTLLDRVESKKSSLILSREEKNQIIDDLFPCYYDDWIKLDL